MQRPCLHKAVKAEGAERLLAKVSAFCLAGNTRGGYTKTVFTSIQDCHAGRYAGFMVPGSISRREVLILLTGAASTFAQEPEPEFVCPMDKDVRSKVPGQCPRCGMKLVAGVPDAREFRVSMRRTSDGLALRVVDPDSGATVRDFELMHERLFHLFVVSQDLAFFAHVHPEFDAATGEFRVALPLSKPGMYRILSDFYPHGATPQLVAGTLMMPGAGFSLGVARPGADLAPKRGENVGVELVLEPPRPLAGFKTMLFFRLSPSEGVEPYLGAMGHMLAASADLIDMMHLHPIYVTEPEGGAYRQIQFNVIFPREGVHRVWVQFQRAGVVNTVAFNVPVEALG